MAKLRFTAPQTVTSNVAKIESFTYWPETNRLETTFVVGDDTAGFQEVKRGHVMLANIPGPAQTALTAIVTRLFTYLVNNGHIPSGTEE